jgi:hypothetical protein
VTPEQPDSLLVEMGLVSGVSVRGRLPLRGHRRVIDALNDVVDGAMRLTHSVMDQEKATSVAVVRRSEVAWIRPIEREPTGTNLEAVVAKRERSLIAYVGSCEIRATAYTFDQVRWTDFLQALGVRFFPVVNARVTTASSSFQAPFIALNAGCVAALLAIEDD